MDNGNDKNISVCCTMGMQERLQCWINSDQCLRCQFGIIIYKHYMGVCGSRGTVKKQKLCLPLIFNQQVNRQHLNNTIQHQFQFQLSNLIIYSLLTKEFKVIFKVEDVMELQFFKKNLIVTEMGLDNATDEGGGRMYQIQWNQSNKIHFTSMYNQLHSKFLSVCFNIDNKNIEVIKINLALIVYGPYHHDIQFPLQNDHIRILFDAKISHIFQASIFIQEFKIKTYQLPNVPNAHFTVTQAIEENPVAYSQQSYNIELPHSNLLLLNQQTGTTFFQEERPNINRLKKNTSFVNLDDDQFSQQLIWRASSKKGTMPSLVVDISTQQIVHHSLQFQVCGSILGDSIPSYIYQAQVPLWKILQKKYTQKYIKAQSGEGQIQVEQRTIRVSQKLYSHHNVVGTCQILVHMQNEKIIEQVKYRTRTQEGIMNIGSNPVAKEIKSNSKFLHQLWQAVNEIGQQLNANQSFKINEKLTMIHHKIMQSKNQIYNDSSKVQSLINNQNIYLTIIQKLTPFLQNNENLTMNSLSWEVTYNILHKNQFHLENLSLKGTYNSNEAKSTLQKKKDVCMKYHSTLNNLIKYALKTYVNPHNMGEGYCNFFALSFLRVRKFRERFLDVLDESFDNDVIEKQLIELQREIEPKTSFNDKFFEMKINWNEFFYKQLEGDPEFKKAEEQLQSFLKNKKWFMEIGFKDQLFYSFCCAFFNKICQLNFGGAQKWKYIDGYSKVVILILGEMKRKQVGSYPNGLIKTSLVMLSNQHLINLLMPLICQKTSLHDFITVQTVLDLIHEYFSYLTKNKTVAICSTFNQNYFFTLVRTIIGGQHFYSINRILIIIYDYFTLLSQHGRYQLSMFLLGNSFFKLFYHWSKDIRCTFYNILLIRIQYIKHRKSAQITSKFNKALQMIAIIQKIQKKQLAYLPAIQQTLLKTLRMKIHHKRKSLSQIHLLYHKGEFQLQNLQRVWSYEFGGFQEPLRTYGEIQEVSEEKTQFSGFKSEENIIVLDIVTPERKKRTYSEQILPFEEYIEKPSPSKQESEAEVKNFKRSSSTYETEKKIYDEKGRRKRKPSVFIGSYSQNTKQYTATITNQLHYFSELTNEQLKNVTRAKQQFKEVKDEILKYIAKYSTYPQRNFSQTNRKQMQA